MSRKILILGACIFALFVMGGVIAIPQLAQHYIRKALANIAEKHGLHLINANVDVRFSHIDIRNIDLKAPGFSVHIRKVAFPSYRFQQWLRPVLEVPTIQVEGLIAEGNIPSSLLAKTKKETTDVKNERLVWKNVNIQGISLDLRTHGLHVVTQDGNYIFSRQQNGRGEFSKIQLHTEHLPVYFIDSAELETQGFTQISRMTLAGLVWAFTKDFEFYAEKATLVPQSEQRLHFLIQGHFLPDRGTLQAKGLYDRKTGQIQSNIEVQNAWVGLALPNTIPVQEPEKIRFSGKVDFERDGSISHIAADGRLWGLTIFDPRIAAAPLTGLDFHFQINARHDANTMTLDVPSANLHLGRLSVQSNAHLTFHPETHKPHIQLALSIAPMACQDVLEALPPALVPNLRTLKLEGRFQGHFNVDVDMHRIQNEEARLSGKMNLDGCRVRSAPPHLRAERLLGDFAFTVTEPGGQRITVEVAQDNEYTRPLEEVSPYMVSSVLTTEDASFWRHNGFIPSEFATALTRNIRAGSFRYGASSITMQIVKNVFFERRKTISRKFEELFYTWYVEKVVPKTRLMEIYLNIIELGPGIYGVPRAAQHFFNKTPLELNVREAIYLASLLPSPKKRYAFYCNQLVPESWERMLNRLLGIMYQRKHITAEEYQQALESRIVFDTSEYPGKNECFRMIRRFQAR